MARLLRLFLLATSACIGAIAVAEESRTSVIEEVVVTAQKREQNIQDTPISTTAFSGDLLRELGFDSSIDLAAQTPGMQMAQNFGEGNIPVINIRGVGLIDFSEHNESPSAVYVDEIYKANLSGLDFQLFDLERAEVLRGPQGTLFGRNATGGLVQYVTAKPSQEMEGYVEAGFGDRGRTRLEGAFGGGLSETVSARVSALYSKHDGYYDNIYPDREDGNQLDTWALRGQLLIEPTETFSALLSFSGGTNQNDGGNPYRHTPVAPSATTGLSEYADTDFFGYATSDSDKRTVETNRQSTLETDFISTFAKLEWAWDQLLLVSITAYESIEKDFQNDPDASPNDIFGTFFDPEGTQFSQEFRLHGDSANSNWILGLYYLSYENDGNQTAEIPVFGINQVVDWDMEMDTWAVFGQYEYDFTDRWTGVLGLRYSDERKDYSNVIDTQDPATGDSLGSVVFDRSTVGDLTRQDSDNLSFKVGINFAATEDVLFYGAVSRAYKGGTFNMGFFPLADLSDVPVDEEEITSVEIGFKSTLANGRARLNGAVFTYDYKDHQAFLFDADTLTNFLFNNDADITGAELELYATPGDRWDLILGVGWLDAKLKDVQDPVGGRITDRDMALAPEFSANGLLRYSLDLSSGDLIVFQGDVSYFGKTSFDAFNSPALVEDAYTVGNVRVSWLSAGRSWEVAAFVDNVTDETYRTFGFDLGSAIGMVQSIYSRPRWWGINARYNF